MSASGVLFADGETVVAFMGDVFRCKRLAAWWNWYLFMAPGFGEVLELPSRGYQVCIAGVRDGVMRSIGWLFGLC